MAVAVEEMDVSCSLRWMEEGKEKQMGGSKVKARLPAQSKQKATNRSVDERQYGEIVYIGLVRVDHMLKRIDTQLDSLRNGPSITRLKQKSWCALERRSTRRPLSPLIGISLQYSNADRSLDELSPSCNARVYEQDAKLIVRKSGKKPVERIDGTDDHRPYAYVCYLVGISPCWGILFCQSICIISWIERCSR